MNWLTSRLGTAAATDPAVAAASDAGVVDVRDLVDREGNLIEDVRTKIREGVALLESGRRVIVCCDYGLSRSNAIAAAILADWSGITLDQAMQTLAEVVSVHEIKLDVLDAVRQATEDFQTKGLTGNTILVTGASGFLGRRLVGNLRPSASVVALGRDLVDLRHGAIPLEGVVRQNGVGTIVHLAHPRVITSNDSLTEAVAMMKTVIDVCAVTGARLVFVSSWEVFSGYGTADIIASESLAPRPVSVYGQSKALCESLMGFAVQTRNVRGCIVRASPVFGVGSERPRFVGAFVRHAIRNEPIVTHLYKNGRPALDLLHVDDAIDGLRRVVAANITGLIHLGTGQTMTTRAVAESVQDTLGTAVPIEERAIATEVANISMSGNRAKAELGWKAQKVISTELGALVQNIAAQQRIGA